MRRLQLLQPLDLAGAARQRFVARRVHRHAARAFFLRGVAGRIRGGEQLLDRAGFAADLDEADGHADVEHAVVPDEAIRGDRAAHVVGDLPRLVERTADQQHAELVAAEARDRVRIAHRFAQQLGDFAQHAVAGQVAAGVVDDLEAVEVEVTQHVRRLAAPRGFGRFVETALELAPVHEARERVVRRLVRHLPMQAAQLGDVVQQDDRASELAVSSRNGDAASSMARSSPRPCRAAPPGDSNCADCRCRRRPLP